MRPCLPSLVRFRLRPPNIGSRPLCRRHPGCCRRPRGSRHHRGRLRHAVHFHLQKSRRRPVVGVHRHLRDPVVGLAA